MDYKLALSKVMYLIFAVTLFSSGAVVFLIQLLGYISIRQFDIKLFRKLNYYCGYAMFSQVVFVSRWWATTKVTLYTKKEDYENYFGKEHTLCVMNHSCEIDWIIANSLLDKVQMLGNIKAFIKHAVKLVPIIGWGFWLQEYIFLTRSFDKDKDAIENQVKELADYPDPIWLLLFPEGTRFTPEKHLKALEFLKERNMPELKHHLVPRTKGFTTSLPFLKKKFQSIYHLELVFADEGKSPANVRALLTGRELDAHIYVRRIPMKDMPDKEEEQEKFLRDLFYEKDKLQDSFKQTGDFFKTSGVKREEAINLNRRFSPLLNFLFWSICTFCPIIYYLFKMLINGNFLYLIICVSVIGLCSVLLNKAIGTVEVKQKKVE